MPAPGFRHSRRCVRLLSHEPADLPMSIPHSLQSIMRIDPCRFGLPPGKRSLILDWERSWPPRVTIQKSWTLFLTTRILPCCLVSIRAIWFVRLRRQFRNLGGSTIGINLLYKTRSSQLVFIFVAVIMSFLVSLCISVRLFSTKSYRRLQLCLMRVASVTRFGFLRRETSVISTCQV